MTNRRRWLPALPVTAVVAVMAVGLVLISLAHWRRGAVAVGAGAALAALLRLWLSDAEVGPLAVRSKAFDVVFYLGAAAVIAAVAIGVSLG